jgi:acyl-CoA synthetase (AMP-forming)/AMP-acid ligase II
MGARWHLAAKQGDHRSDRIGVLGERSKIGLASREIGPSGSCRRELVRDPMTGRRDTSGSSSRGSSSVETLSGLLEAGRSDDVALVSAESSRSITFGQLRDRVNSLAGSLRAAGVGRGDRVALVVSNGPDFIQCVLAVAHLGAAAAPLNPAYTSTEHAFYLRDLDPQLLLLPQAQFKAAREAATPELHVADLASDEKQGVFIDSIGAKAPNSRPSEQAARDDHALLLHTSGTTSRPKLVPLLHRSLVASVNAILHHYELSNEDVTYCVMPLFHVHGLLASVLAPLAAGGRVIVPNRLSASGFWESVARDRITWFSAAPTLHQMLLDKRPIDAPLPRELEVRFVRSCSSALSSKLFARMEDEFEAPVLEAYGMTEASHQIASNPLPPKPRFAQSVGVPTGSEVVILAADGSALGTDQAGEVAIRGPSVMPGYLGNPEANAEAFHDGWFKTGDRGSIDGRGYLRLEGRIKELIIRGGENISPIEVEDVLLRHPAVAQAICFAVPDSKYGESVGVGVVLRARVQPEELLRHCREYLAPHKIPTLLRFIDDIPRTATGKPRRHEAASLLVEEERD